MVFRPIIEFYNVTNSVWHNKCVQRCSCISDIYIEKKKQCIERRTATTNYETSPIPVTILQVLVELLFKKKR